MHNRRFSTGHDPDTLPEVSVTCTSLDYQVLPSMHTGFDRDKGGASLLLLVATGWVFMCGCQRDATLTGANIRKGDVRVVTDQGLILDEQAAPTQVAFVLLRAIRDEVRAEDPDARERAFQRQFDLCAPETIYQANYRYYTRLIGSYTADRDETVYRAVRSWAARVARYVDAFDFDWPAAERRFAQSAVGKAASDGSEITSVLVEAADPDGDPNASVVVKIDLTRESGFWRVRWIGFWRKDRHLGRPGPSTSAPSKAETDA